MLGTVHVVVVQSDKKRAYLPMFELSIRLILIHVLLVTTLFGASYLLLRNGVLDGAEYTILIARSFLLFGLFWLVFTLISRIITVRFPELSGYYGELITLVIHTLIWLMFLKSPEIRSQEDLEETLMKSLDELSETDLEQQNHE